MDVSDADITTIENRLWTSRFVNSLPQPPPLTGWAKEQHDIQAAKLQERRATAAAEEERARLAREAAAERRRAEFEANAPKRERAKVELAKLGREIEALEGQQERLWERARELEQEAKR